MVNTSTTIIADVTQQPFFEIGIREAFETTIQLNWDNNTGNIDFVFYGRASADSQFTLLKFCDEDGETVDKATILGAKGNHLFHFDRKFHDMEVRFIVNSGQADVNLQAVLE